MKRLTLLFFALLLPFAPTPGCTAGTGRPIVDAEIAFGGTPDAARFVTGRGWTVTLDEARIVLGPVHALAPRDELAMRPSALLEGAAALLPLPSVARAHSGLGVLDGRTVRLEFLEQVAVDALAAERQVFPTPAELGASDELFLGLQPPVDRHVEALRGFHAFVRGAAEKDGETVRFEGGLTLGESEAERRVTTVAFAADFEPGCRLDLEVDPRPWLDGVDFDQVGVPGDEVHELALDGQAHAAWRIGARRSNAYAATYLPGSP